MIVRAKTPKGLSRAGRFAVLGMAALCLPLTPSLGTEGRRSSGQAKSVCYRCRIETALTDPAQPPSQGAKSIEGCPARIAVELKKDPEVLGVKQEIDETREHIEHIEHRSKPRATVARSGTDCAPASIRQVAKTVWRALEFQMTESFSLLTMDEKSEMTRTTRPAMPPSGFRNT